MTKFVKSIFMFCLITWGVLGCGAGPYSFDRYYVPLDDEAPFHASAESVTFGMVTARPQDYQGKLIGWFGIVKDVQKTKDGRSLVQLAFHKHRNRHLCEGETSDTCRVTVNQKSTGEFSAAVQLSAADTRPGLEKVQPGTLMRVFGRVRCVKDENDNDVCDHDKDNRLILYCDYYRQWPARYYRTTRSRGKMVR